MNCYYHYCYYYYYYYDYYYDETRTPTFWKKIY